MDLDQCRVAGSNGTAYHIKLTLSQEVLMVVQPGVCDPNGVDEEGRNISDTSKAYLEQKCKDGP